MTRSGSENGMRVLGVGIDLVDIARVERMLERHGERVLAKVLTDGEREYVRATARPAAHLAARIAAKEATYKALQAWPGARGVGWTEMEVRHLQAGRPVLVLHGRARALLEREAGGPLQLELSITHSETAAAAVVVIIGG
jgi:holo-[acyl-carrier protein] synthase